MEAYWLGSSHNCYESLDIETVSKPMKILGIYFTYNLRLKNELNFDVTLKSLKKALNNWQWRNFTVAGKIHLRYQNCNAKTVVPSFCVNI